MISPVNCNIKKSRTIKYLVNCLFQIISTDKKNHYSLKNKKREIYLKSTSLFDLYDCSCILTSNWEIIQ